MPPRHAPPARRSVASGASVEQNTSGRARGPDVFCSTNTGINTGTSTGTSTSTSTSTGASTDAGAGAPIPPGQRNRCGNAAATYGYPTNTAASSRQCVITRGSSRPHRVYIQPNTIPITAFPTKAPKPWYRW
ncbi:hypothetical protein DEU32_101196 [Curtobacterium sp. AG1037]|nr:hypothetical protein DEU32_101196 [Curtobacterium sp. AG1037]TQJ27216.1 hypothetical protein FB462_1064 [Curtobacterium citreum]